MNTMHSQSRINGRNRSFSSAILVRLVVGILMVGIAVPLPAGFREDNIALFRITLPPTTSDHRLMASFESSHEILFGWRPGLFDSFAANVISQIWGSAPIVIFPGSVAETQYMSNLLIASGLPAGEVANPSYLRVEMLDRDTPWIGDYGPLAIKHASSGKISLVDPRYFDLRHFDDKVPTELGSSRGINVFRPSVMLPRSVVTDGQGTCFVSERDSLENLPDPDNTALKTLMEDYLGCLEVLVIPPLYNAGTGNLSLAFQFLSSNIVIVGSQTSEIDCVNRDRLDAIATILETVESAPGVPRYQVHRVPFPPDTDGFLRSYTDLIMVNGYILLPEFPGFSSHNDEVEAIVSSLMPTWTLKQIDTSVFQVNNGGIGSLVVNLPVGDYSAHQDPPESRCGDQPTCQTAGCGNVTYEGFCTNDTVVWCQLDQIHTYECSTPCFFLEPGQMCEKSCGLTQGGYYDCNGKYSCIEPEPLIFKDGFENGIAGAWSFEACF